MRQRLSVVWSIAAVTLFSLSAAAQLAPAATARIDDVFKRFTSATPGCAVLVRENGKAVYSRGFGLASVELGVPITPSTVFNVGSASKQFTAASVLLLARDGKLSLDDDIRRYVPELPDLGPRVTLRELLTHTSGWRDYIQLLVWQGHEVRDHVTARDAMNILRRQRAFNFQPGTEYRYSNTGYFLLSLVVRRVSGDSLAEFARKRIFEPLGMNDTRYVSDVRQIVKNGASAYEPAPGNTWRQAMSGWELVGAGGVYTTTGDLAKWDDNFTSGIVGGTALGDSLAAVEHLSNGVPIPYGLGLFVDRYAGQQRIWHNGIWAGYRAILMRFPQSRHTIVALCNASDVVSEPLADAVADIVLPHTPGAPAAGGDRVLDRVRVADANQITGVYYSGSTNQRVSIVGDSGAIAITGAPPIRLAPLGQRKFRLPTGTTVLEFQPATGETQTMLSRTDGRMSAYSRVAPPLSPSDFGQYAGRYRSSELGTEWTVVVSGGDVSIRDERGDDTPIRPAFRDAFDGPGTVRFQRDATGAVTALTMTTTGVYLLGFDRT